MTLHLTHPQGFGPGVTWITTVEERDDPAGIGVGVWVLQAGQIAEERVPSETAVLLMKGTVELRANGRLGRFERASIFDGRPSAAHVPAGARLGVEARSAAELLIFRTANVRVFAPALYGPGDVEDERRGEGLLRDAALRIVRTILDDRRTGPGADLVLGEVVTLPGRWSSYPPHHHPQPEIYHYRFTDPRGWGHAELGDQILKVRHNDTVKILAGEDHPQCAAPGYGMYYAWVIRHLEGARYRGPELSSAHAWTLQEDAPLWWPEGVK